MLSEPLFQQGRIDKQNDSMEGSLSSSESLKAALTSLECKRQFKTVLPVVMPVQPRKELTKEPIKDLADLSNSNLVLCSGYGSNNTLNTFDTLNSSADMLTHEQAFSLSPTNAPIMKPFIFAKKPNSVKSL